MSLAVQGITPYVGNVGPAIVTVICLVRHLTAFLTLDMARISCVITADTSSRPGHQITEFGCPADAKGRSGCSHKRDDKSTMAGPR